MVKKAIITIFLILVLNAWVADRTGVNHLSNLSVKASAIINNKFPGECGPHAVQNILQQCVYVDLTVDPAEKGFGKG